MRLEPPVPAYRLSANTRRDHYSGDHRLAVFHPRLNGAHNDNS
jgi:hypothetical protein